MTHCTATRAARRSRWVIVSNEDWQQAVWAVSVGVLPPSRGRLGSGQRGWRGRAGAQWAVREWEEGSCESIVHHVVHYAHMHAPPPPPAIMSSTCTSKQDSCWTPPLLLLLLPHSGAVRPASTTFSSFQADVPCQPPTPTHPRHLAVCCRLPS